MNESVEKERAALFDKRFDRIEGKLDGMEQALTQLIVLNERHNHLEQTVATCVAEVAQMKVSVARNTTITTVVLWVCTTFGAGALAWLGRSFIMGG